MLSLVIAEPMLHYTVKLGDKEQIGIKEPFPVITFANLFHKDKEHLV